MVPFWGKQLFIRVALLTALSVVLLAVVWSISQSPGQAGNGLAQGKASEPRPEADKGSKTAPGSAKPPKDDKAITPATEVGPTAPAVEVGPAQLPTPNPPAAEVPADPAKPNPPAAEVGADKPPRQEPNGKEIRGTVRGFDPQKRTVTLRVGEKRETAYRLAQNARISIGANDMPLRDIKPGTRVRAVLGNGDMIVELKVDRGRSSERPGEDKKSPEKKPGGERPRQDD